MLRRAERAGQLAAADRALPRSNELLARRRELGARGLEATAAVSSAASQSDLLPLAALAHHRCFEAVGA